MPMAGWQHFWRSCGSCVSLPLAAGSVAVLQCSWQRSPLRAEGNPVGNAPTRRPVSWLCLHAYASDQLGELAAKRGPARSPEIDERYGRYFRWLQARGQRGGEYLVQTAQWRTVSGGPSVALEPNIVPYELESGIEHWILWYHPETTPGSADLDLLPGAEVELRAGCSLGMPALRGCILAVRRAEHSADPTFVISLGTGDSVATSGDALAPCRDQRRWAAVLGHLRLFLPFVEDDEVVIFQNVRALRSVPDVAHAHVFIKPRTWRTKEAVQQLRSAWRLRSPWAEAERLTGRGSEVGWYNPGE